MKKFYINVFIYLLFSLVSSQAGIINDIKVDGNQRISKESIIVLGNIIVNESYESDDLNDSLKKSTEI